MIVVGERFVNCRHTFIANGILLLSLELRQFMPVARLPAARLAYKCPGVCMGAALLCSRCHLWLLQRSSTASKGQRQRGLNARCECGPGAHHCDDWEWHRLGGELRRKLELWLAQHRKTQISITSCFICESSQQARRITPWQRTETIQSFPLLPQGRGRMC